MMRWFHMPDLEVAAVAAAKQINDGNIGPGARVKELEAKLAEMHGKKYCILTVSGTVALQLAILAFRGPHPQKLICAPAYGTWAVPNAIISAAQNVCFLDVDPNTGAMVLPEHGRRYHDFIVDVPFSGIYDKQRRMSNRTYGCGIIEDAACALGEPEVGTLSDATVLSFSAQKIISCGQGGAVLCDDESTAMFIQDQVDHGQFRSKGKDAMTGGSNLRMDDIRAAMILAQLPDLPRRIQERNVVKQCLSQIKGFWQAPRLHNIVRTEARNGTRDALIGHLYRKKIEARRNYFVLPTSPAYVTQACTTELNGANALLNESVYLPFGGGLTIQMAEQIVDACRDF